MGPNIGGPGARTWLLILGNDCLNRGGPIGWDDGESADWGRFGDMGDPPVHSFGVGDTTPFPNLNGGHSTRLKVTALVENPFVLDKDGRSKVGRRRL